MNRTISSCSAEQWDTLFWVNFFKEDDLKRIFRIIYNSYEIFGGFPHCDFTIQGCLVQKSHQDWKCAFFITLRGWGLGRDCGNDPLERKVKEELMKRVKKKEGKTTLNTFPYFTELDVRTIKHTKNRMQCNQPFLNYADWILNLYLEFCWIKDLGVKSAEVSVFE